MFPVIVNVRTADWSRRMGFRHKSITSACTLHIIGTARFDTALKQDNILPVLLLSGKESQVPLFACWMSKSNKLCVQLTHFINSVILIRMVIKQPTCYVTQDKPYCVWYRWKAVAKIITGQSCQQVITSPSQVTHNQVLAHKPLEWTYNEIPFAFHCYNFIPIACDKDLSSDFRQLTFLGLSRNFFLKGKMS